jgi:hypothetical protein
MSYQDEEENYDPDRFQSRRHFRKLRDRDYVSNSIGKLPNELRQYLSDDDDFNHRFSYPDDYL